jgi:hypothetical protein
LECDSPGFIPSSPYIGADGGWDGYYPGYYRLEDQTGIWSIQSKWTTKTKTEAMSPLKAEIKKEIDKSTKNKVDHLRIATNAEFDVEQVLELNKLAEGTGISLKVWHREALTIRIESQPFLRHYFFGSPQFPKFVPWNMYFDQLEPDLLPVNVNISCLDEYANKAREFLASKTSSILSISSPGGYGKSHLLRRIAAMAREVDSQLQAWMIRGGIRVMQDAIQDEIVQGRRYVLLFDDADRFPDEIAPLLSLVRSSDSIKVVLSMRNSGQESVNGKIRQLRVGSLCSQIDISSWKNEDLIMLLRQATGQAKVEHESTIATLYPNPYLLVWIGRQIAKKPISDLKALKRGIIDDMDHEAMTCLANSNVESILVNLSCIVPFHQDLQDPVLSALATAIGISQSLVRESIGKMTTAGILRVVGNSVRFNPDMKGDVYLADKLQTKINEEKLNELTHAWMPICPKNFMTNLASAATFAELPVAEKALSRLMRSWAEGTIPPFRSKREVISALVEISDFLPVECLNIMDAYVKSSNDLTSDDYGPVLLNLARIEGVRNRVLETLLAVYTKVIEGRYDNYKPKSLIRDCVSPLLNTEKIIKDTITQLSRWLNNPDHATKLVSFALSEVLAGTHEFSESGIITWTYGSRAVRDTAAIRGIRDQAIEVLDHMLDHSSLDVKLEALDVADAVGCIHAARQKEEDLPLAVRIREERAKLTTKIGSMLGQNVEFRLLNKIEQLFLKWWAQQTPGTDEVEGYLDEMSRSPEYIALSYFAPSLFVIEDFNLLKAEAPKEGRWEWFVQSKMKHGFYTESEFGNLVELLGHKYRSPQQIVGFLCELDKATSDSRIHPPIVSLWAKTDPSTFTKIADDSPLWRKIPDKFRKEIGLALAENNEKSLIRLAREALSELPNGGMASPLLYSLRVCPITKTSSYSNLAEMLDEGRAEKRGLLLLSAYCTSDRIRIDIFGKAIVTQFTLYRWLAQIINEGNSTTRTAALFSLLYLAERIESNYLLVRLIRLALSKERSLSDSMTSNLSILLDKKKDGVESLDDKTQRRLKLDLMTKLKEQSSIDYYAEKLLEFACDGINPLLNLLERRIRVAETSKDILYEVTPLGGLPIVEQLVKSFEDYEKLIAGMISLCERYPKWSSTLQRLMESSEQNRLHCTAFIKKEIAAGHYATGFAASRFLPFNATSLPILTDVAEQGVESGKTAEVKSLLEQKMLPSSAESSAIGEPSPGLVARKALFEEMHKIAKSPKLLAIIDDCTRGLDAVIQTEIRADQEILNPRS